ncbi:probable RNA-binding protein ARP1 [Vicia villosa]|uniref:probable RNA-binding protein ARP1 n=1 Tax=Vicia villosa TaxID=3911 RepID=UPI00273AC599|nr:probable RNA-binding protein ARP1 [Vicia villosa]
MSPNVVVPKQHSKVFVGGLAWKTQTDTLKSYFDQFGEILEAVVIIDRTTGKSKGYGFVTFKDPNSAIIACQNPNPVIDGRRTNCNLALAKSNPSTSTGRRNLNSPSWNYAPLQFSSSYNYYNQHLSQYAYPYPVYRYSYPGYLRPHNIYDMNYPNVYGGPQFPVPLYPPYYQPFYGHSKHLVPTSYVKKTQFPGPTITSSSGAVKEIVGATRVVESPKDQTSSN